MQEPHSKLQSELLAKLRKLSILFDGGSLQIWCIFEAYTSPDIKTHEKGVVMRRKKGADWLFRQDQAKSVWDNQHMQSDRSRPSKLGRGQSLLELPLASGSSDVTNSIPSCHSTICCTIAHAKKTDE